MKASLRSASNFGALPLLLFLLLPPLALVLKGKSLGFSGLNSPDTLSAIWVSLRTTTVSLISLVVFGLPVCLVLTPPKGIVGRLVDPFIDLPVVLPPAAAGIGLLVAFGRHGLIPTGLPFSVGAVICAQIFVSAPLFIRSGTAAFSTVAPEVVEQAKTEGANNSSIFFKIVLPIGGPTFLGGAAMAWARALGEFGATLLFAGNLPGKTQTMPLAIYLGFESDLSQAIGLSTLLLTIAAVVLLVAKLVPYWGNQSNTDSIF